MFMMTWCCQPSGLSRAEGHHQGEKRCSESTRILSPQGTTRRIFISILLFTIALRSTRNIDMHCHVDNAPTLCTTHLHTLSSLSPQGTTRRIFISVLLFTIALRGSHSTCDLATPNVPANHDRRPCRSLSWPGTSVGASHYMTVDNTVRRDASMMFLGSSCPYTLRDTAEECRGDQAAHQKLRTPKIWSGPTTVICTQQHHSDHTAPLGAGMLIEYITLHS